MSTIAQRTVENFAARVAAQAFSIAGAIVVARMLGPAGKGAFSYAGTVLAMLQMANAGQAAAISWQYAKQRRSPAELLTAMVRILLLFALPACALLVIIAGLMPDQRALLAVALALPFALFAQSSMGFFLADGDVRMVNVQQILIGVVSVAAYIPLLIFAHAGLGVLLAVWACGYVVGALYSAWRLRRYAHDGQATPGANVVKEQLVYGGQVSLNSAVQFLNFRIDVFLIMFMLGQTQLGIYSIGIGIGEMLWQLSRPMVTAAFGSISRGTEREAANTTAACMRHSFALVLTGAVIIYFAVPPLVPLVYGPQFANAAIVARVLLPGIIAYSMMPTLATFFAQQLGQPRIPLIFSSVSTALCAGITVLLLPHVGIIGGAIATSVSYCVAFAAAVTYFVRRTRIGPRQIFALSRSDLNPYRALLASIYRRAKPAEN
ncbi:MAG TPA: oligosaccharide flippase family protein [Candidatus Baltobacteraceae bacterium]|nr:oligosaccharide flippase family protein [Candidatus Baltobacteraceae bacterium]